MGNIKDLHIDKLNYIKQNFSNLINNLAYNSAKDEAFTNELVTDEEDLFNDDGIWDNETNKDKKVLDLPYTEEFQPIYDRWKEYYESMFYEFIEPNKLIIYNSGIDPYVPNNEYVLVCWPESQIFMEEEWFQEEAILEAEGKFGSSAYLIPKNRLK